MCGTPAKFLNSPLRLWRATMKAAVFKRYGSPEKVLMIADVPTPSPEDDEVLIRVRASSVNYGNSAHIMGKPFIARFWTGLSRPKSTIAGGDLAGVVEAVGADVTRFKVGDEIYGDVADNKFSAWAEYTLAPERMIALKPRAMSFEEAAAAAQSAPVALAGLRKGGIQAGQRVLIVGASGGIGTYAVQIAKALGANVSATCGSRNVKLVRSLGADNVYDYTKSDFTSDDSTYDLILATTGYHKLSDYKRSLTPTGNYVATGGDSAQVFEAMLLGPMRSRRGGKRMTNLYYLADRELLEELGGLINDGKVKSVIDSRFPLENVVDAVVRYNQRHTTGKVVITI
jgi:NADPH:quinone reductase-like Zn-dependent oxidoreductase